MTKLLEIKNLSVKSVEGNKEILTDVSIEIDHKSIYVLIGPNGSGKSTLAYSLMGLPRFKITQGQIIFSGKKINKLPPHKRAKAGITLAFQEPAYFEGLTVENFLKAGNEKLSRQEVEKIISLVGLEPKEFLNRTMNHNLSTGERKRIELASVIAMKSKLIILDEPDAGLDIIVYHELYNILNNIKKETNASILLITHREEAGIIANKAAFLKQGKIICRGSFRRVMISYCQSSGRKKLCQKVCPNNL